MAAIFDELKTLFSEIKFTREERKLADGFMCATVKDFRGKFMSSSGVCTDKSIFNLCSALACSCTSFVTKFFFHFPPTKEKRKNKKKK